MSKPLSEDEQKLLAQFLRGLVQGTVQIGFGSFSVLELYKRAQANRQNMFDILMSDPQVCIDLANMCRKGAARLPASVLAVLKQIIVEAEDLQAEARQSVPSSSGSDHDEP